MYFKSLLLLGMASLLVVSLANDVSQRYPLLLTTSIELPEISKTTEMSSDILRDVTNAFLEKQNKTADKTVLFEISTKLNSQEIVKFIQKSREEFPKLAAIFSNKKSSFASRYSDNANILSEIENEYKARGVAFESFNTVFNQAEFTRTHEAILTNDKPTVESVAIDFSSLHQLEKIISADIDALRAIEKSFLIILNFKQVEQGSSYDFTRMKFVQSLESEKRVLEEVVAPTTVKDTPEPIGISGNTLSGYLIFLFMLFVILLGTLTLFDIQTPTKFASSPFVVGRES